MTDLPLFISPECSEGHHRSCARQWVCKCACRHVWPFRVRVSTSSGEDH